MFLILGMYTVWKFNIYFFFQHLFFTCFFIPVLNSNIQSYKKKIIAMWKGMGHCTIVMEAGFENYSSKPLSFFLRLPVGWAQPEVKGQGHSLMWSMKVRFLEQRSEWEEVESRFARAKRRDPIHLLNQLSPFYLDSLIRK